MSGCVLTLPANAAPPAPGLSLYGTVVLHVAPEAAAGGPLAVVRNGDEILLDGPNRRLELLVSDGELRSRLADWQRNRPKTEVHSRLLPAIHRDRDAGQPGL